MKVLLITFFMSAVPLIEQRGAIPYGIFSGQPFWLVFLVGLAGSMLPVPFILIAYDKLYKFLMRYKIFSRVVKILDKKIEKNRETFEKYQELALIIFIGIPLPTTGLWTGSVIAAFLKLDFKKSILCALIGGAISAALITIMCLYIPEMFKAH